MNKDEYITTTRDLRATYEKIVDEVDTFGEISQIPHTPHNISELKHVISSDKGGAS